jgi:hypothetical protein
MAGRQCGCKLIPKIEIGQILKVIVGVPIGEYSWSDLETCDLEAGCKAAKG